MFQTTAAAATNVLLYHAVSYAQLAASVGHQHYLTLAAFSADQLQPAATAVDVLVTPGQWQVVDMQQADGDDH